MLRTSAHHAGGGKQGSNINFIRHVPKFLQGHAHLLGKPQDSTEEQLTAKKAVPDTWDSEEDDEAERQVCECPLWNLESGVQITGSSAALQRDFAEAACTWSAMCHAPNFVEVAWS